METNLSIFLTAVIQHPVRLATSLLVVAGLVYVAASSVGLDNTSSMVSGLIAGSIFVYVNTVNTEARRVDNTQQEDASFFSL